MTCNVSTCPGYDSAAKDKCVTCKGQTGQLSPWSPQMRDYGPRVPERGDLPAGIRWMLEFYMVPVVVIIAIVMIYGNWDRISGWIAGVLG